jgi:hypothetical protein
MIEKASALSHFTFLSTFLVRQSWGSFHEDILSLQELTQVTIEDNRKNAILVKTIQKHDKRFIAPRIRDVATDEAISHPASCYDLLTTMILDFGNYTELLITSQMIDEWWPSTLKDESVVLA